MKSLLPVEAGPAVVVRFEARNEDDRPLPKYKDDRPFIENYIDALRYGDVFITDWMIANYQRMSESMFYDGGWEGLGPREIVTLRIYAPAGVFSETAKTGFLTRVGSDPKWSDIVKSVFAPTDFGFLGSLPESEIPKVKLLLRFAYDNHIRKADPNVLKS